MSSLRVGVFATTSTLLALIAAATWIAWPASPRVLDAVVADYLEDAPGARPIAALGARLLAQGERRWLELVVAARGPRVVPVPGLEGVHGTNLRTAQELHRLLRDGRLRPRLRDGAGREAGAGRVVAVAEEPLPSRRLGADGDVDLHATTAAAWPVEVTLVSDPLPAEAASFELLVDGTARLRVSVAGDRVAAVESLGEPPYALRRPAGAGVGQ